MEGAAAFPSGSSRFFKTRAKPGKGETIMKKIIIALTAAVFAASMALAASPAATPATGNAGHVKKITKVKARKTVIKPAIKTAAPIKKPAAAATRTK